MHKIIVDSALFLLLILIIWGIIWGIIKGRKQVIKDWETLYDLENRCMKLTTLEEVVQFHMEFTEKAGKIHNEFINPRLARIDGYLRGQYKALGGK